MSIAQNPLMGPMRKSMGNFTVYTLNGMNIVRSKAFDHKDAKTEKQLIMRERMTLFAALYRRLRGIIDLGFPEREQRQSPQNRFVSVNFKTAFGTGDTLPVVGYPRLLVAQGSLPTPAIPQATTDAGGITLKYDALALAPEVTATDEIIACALLSTDELLMARQFIGHEPMGTLQMKYPDLNAEEVVCCYAFVRSGDGGKASDSVWVEII